MDNVKNVDFSFVGRPHGGTTPGHESGRVANGSAAAKGKTAKCPAKRARSDLPRLSFRAVTNRTDAAERGGDLIPQHVSKPV